MREVSSVVVRWHGCDRCRSKNKRVNEMTIAQPSVHNVYKQLIGANFNVKNSSFFKNFYLTGKKTFRP